MLRALDHSFQLRGAAAGPPNAHRMLGESFRRHAHARQVRKIYRSLTEQQIDHSTLHHDSSTAHYDAKKLSPAVRLMWSGEPLPDMDSSARDRNASDWTSAHGDKLILDSWITVFFRASPAAAAE